MLGFLSIQVSDSSSVSSGSDNSLGRYSSVSVPEDSSGASNDGELLFDCDFERVGILSIIDVDLSEGLRFLGLAELMLVEEVADDDVRWVRVQCVTVLCHGCVLFVEKYFSQNFVKN